MKGIRRKIRSEVVQSVYEAPLTASPVDTAFLFARLPVDFSATTYSEVGGPPQGPVGSTVNGRAFVRVYAVHKTTGEQFLLLYEDITHRRRPVQIIRFVPGTDAARP
jgi:hypothetical protein